jgi:S1-C subfamily serine protease
MSHVRSTRLTAALAVAASVLVAPLSGDPLLAAPDVETGSGKPSASAGPSTTLASAGSAPAPATLAELLDEARKWIVAIEVEREEGDDADLGTPRQGRRRDGEARAYFERPAGAVTGMLLDAEGHVLTTRYNVYGKVKSLRVHLDDGRALRATLVATSRPDDLALLRIAREPDDPALPDAPIRWSSQPELRAGQVVFALGRSPDPGSVTLTRGIVSAVARNGDRAFQTDAELNYGNVGGPLIDLDGRVIGVASHVGHHEPQWGINSGVGFGTNARTVAIILPELKSGRDVEWGEAPLLGVYWNTAAYETHGAEVQRVEPGSAADKAGLRQGDRILEIDGAPVASFPHLRRVIFLKGAHQKIRLGIRRGEEELELEATLGVRPERRGR